MKLGQARDLLASETSLRKKAEADRDQIAAKWDLVRELIRWAGGLTNMMINWHKFYGLKPNV